MRPHRKYILHLDVKNGFLVKPGASKLKYPVVAVGSLKELKRQADLMNYQFEKI